MKSLHRRSLMAVLLLAIVPDAIAAQTRLTVTVRSDDVNAGFATSCSYETTRIAEVPDPEHPGTFIEVQDTVVVSIVDDKGDPSTTASELLLRVGDGPFRSIDAGISVDTIAVGERGLNDAVVMLKRPEAGANPLCSSTPVRLYSPAVNLGVTHHDLFAGGEISSALRTGTSETSATGSLGLHTRSYRTEDNPFLFPFGFLPPSLGRELFSYQVHLEELRATVAVVGSADTLFAPDNRQEYAQAVLSPLTAARGNLSSVNVMYSPQQRYAGNSLRGLRFSAGATRSVWAAMVPDSTAPDGNVREGTDVTMFLGDVRAHFVFINHVEDNGGNVFSFAMNFGAAYRGILGDIAAHANGDLLEATLGTTKRHFWGPVGGLELKLRQVTAFADLLHLLGNDVESLQGVQPIIGFRFDAPMFRVTPRDDE